jgi:hypothetical protein
VLPTLLLSLLLGTSGCGGEPAARPNITHGVLVPGEPIAADLDGDGVAEQVQIDPADDSITISDGSVFYRSRAKWKVVQAVLGDTDRNGLTEIVALLDSDKGRHLAVFACFGGAYRERLVTQAIDPAPLGIEIVADVTDGGRRDTGGSAGAAGADELVVLIQPPPATGGEVQRTLLRWNGFGYTRVEEAPGE